MMVEVGHSTYLLLAVDNALINLMNGYTSLEYNKVLCSSCLTIYFQLLFSSIKYYKKSFV